MMLASIKLVTADRGFKLVSNASYKIVLNQSVIDFKGLKSILPFKKPPITVLFSINAKSISLPSLEQYSLHFSTIDFGSIFQQSLAKLDQYYKQNIRQTKVYHVSNIV